MADCLRCDRRLSLLGFLQAWKAKTYYCQECLQEITITVARLEEELEQMYNTDAGVTSESLQYFRDQAHEYSLPETFTLDLFQRSGRLLEFTRYRIELPRIRVTRILDTDEHAHHETSAIYHKKNKEIKYIRGTLLLTNKRLYFFGEDGTNSFKIGYNNISQATPVESTTMMLHVEQGRGGGLYEVPDSEKTALILHIATLAWKGHLVSLRAQSSSQEVPEHIKVAVMQRDKGTCQMCGYQDPYIEFDHIIPRSKGGPNTIENIQLLCRGCNRRKSNKLLQ